MECIRGLAMRILSVRPSVCPSAKRVHCDKTEEKSVQIFSKCERICHRPSVRLSVCLSLVCNVRTPYLCH